VAFLGKPGLAGAGKVNRSGFSEARDNEVAVASAGPYTDHMHFAPDR